MSFDYKYTCPDIDNVLNSVKDIFEVFLIEAIEDVAPDMNQSDKDEFISMHTKDVEERIIMEFDVVRSINSDMRDEASVQIENLESEIDNLKSNIRELELELENLE